MRSQQETKTGAALSRSVAAQQQGGEAHGAAVGGAGGRADRTGGQARTSAGAPVWQLGPIRVCAGGDVEIR